jgi:hypothetical protein
MEWATFNSLIRTERESGFRFPRVISSAAETNTQSVHRRGNGNENIGKFGGAEQLRTAVNQPQSLLYAA